MDMKNLIDVENLPSAPYKPLADLAWKTSAEWSVLLKNEGRVLPLSKENTISFFGCTQIEYYKSGIGSGGQVRTEYVVNILQGIRNNLKLRMNEELAEALANGEITRGQLQRNAMNVLGYVLNSRSFERFERGGVRFEKSLAESPEALVLVKQIVNPESEKEYESGLLVEGKYLVEIEYSSEESDIAQLPICIMVNGVSAVSVSVNGTGGKNNVLYRDIYVQTEKSKMSVVYSKQLLSIEKVGIKKLHNE